MYKVDLFVKIDWIRENHFLSENIKHVDSAEYREGTMKRTLIDLLWSEIDFEIKYIIVIEITYMLWQCTFCIMGQRVNLISKFKIFARFLKYSESEF